MKRLSPILCAFALAALLLPSLALGADARGNETVTVGATETLNDDLYAVGETITVNGTVNGDVIVLSGRVTVTGTVNGSVWAAGSDVTVRGSVTGSVRAAGATVILGGTVGGDILVAGSDVNFEPTARVGRDVLAAGANVNLAGTIARNAKVAGDRVSQAATIGGTLDARTGERFVLANGSRVAGSVTYQGPNELTREGTATVGGAVNYTETSEKRAGYFERLGDQLYWFLAAVLLLFATLLYARRAAGTAAKLILSRPGWALLAGTVFLISVPLVCLLLLVTFVGIPLSILAAIIYLIIIYEAKLFVALAAGQSLLRRSADSFWYSFGAGLIGLTLFYAIAAIPVIGPIVTITVVLFGVGGQLLLFKQFYADNRKKYGA